MICELKRPGSIRAVCALALFFFVFLGTEYLFDNCLASATDAEGVVRAQNYVLGISTIGFCLYGILSKWLERLSKGGLSGILVAAGLILSGCMICIFLQGSYASMMAAGMVWFLLIGIIGSAIHFHLGYVLKNRKVLARMAGLSYALGIFLQFLNNNLVRTDLVETIVLLVFTLLLVGFLCIDKEKQETAETESTVSKDSTQKNSVMSGVLMILTVFFLAFIFSTLDSVVTMVHAGGSVDIGQWPRLLLGASGLLAGFLYDIKDRRFMHLIMYCIAVLSTSCIVVIAFGGPFLLGLFVFYIAAGFFSVYFTAGFLDLSYSMQNPKLWAGLGRAVNNASAVLITLCFSSYFSHMHYGMILVTLVLFVVISICMVMMQSVVKQVRDLPFDMDAHCNGMTVCTSMESAAGDSQGVKTDKLSAERKLELFVEQYAVTEREAEVLSALLSSDANVQDIAKDLGVSRAALYRHIANLNEKTNTKARIGLIQFYYEWVPEM